MAKTIAAGTGWSLEEVSGHPHERVLAFQCPGPVGLRQQTDTATLAMTLSEDQWTDVLTKGLMGEVMSKGLAPAWELPFREALQDYLDLAWAMGHESGDACEVLAWLTAHGVEPSPENVFRLLSTRIAGVGPRLIDLIRNDMAAPIAAALRQL